MQSERKSESRYISFYYWGLRVTGECKSNCNLNANLTFITFRFMYWGLRLLLGLRSSFRGFNTGAFSIGSAFLLFLNAMHYGNITNLPSFNAMHYLQLRFLFGSALTVVY
jgi:hypothetical protein